MTHAMKLKPMPGVLIGCNLWFGCSGMFFSAIRIFEYVVSFIADEGMRGIVALPNWSLSGGGFGHGRSTVDTGFAGFLLGIFVDILYLVLSTWLALSVFHSSDDHKKFKQYCVASLIIRPLLLLLPLSLHAIGRQKIFGGDVHILCGLLVVEVYEYVALRTLQRLAPDSLGENTIAADDAQEKATGVMTQQNDKPPDSGTAEFWDRGSVGHGSRLSEQTTLVETRNHGAVIATTGAILHVLFFFLSIILVVMAFRMMQQVLSLDSAEQLDREQLPNFALLWMMLAICFLLYASSVGLIMIALIRYRFRSVWLFWFIVFFSLYSLGTFPIGTVVGVGALTFCYLRENEFRENKHSRLRRPGC
ncbi:MAG: hypothetical protein WKF77_32385 [Planctomycetaceae bacterium]